MRALSAFAAMVLAVLAAGGAHAAVCGDGVVEPPELCDDGNLVDGDGCDSNCTPTGCGNGIVTAGEECDDGNRVSGDCCSATCQNENLPPDCSGARPSVAGLWPPNHSLEPVTIEGVTDPDGDALTLRITAIAQDEPIDATGDGATCPDGDGVGSGTAVLRAERSGGGDGRVYHVAFEAIDRCGATCTGAVVVCVPHDQGHGDVCGDGGPQFDSTAGAPPCSGPACGPADCVPDPDEVGGCGDDHVPAAVAQRLSRLRTLVAHRHRKAALARRLAGAARRVERAAKRGALSGGCAAAIVTALDGVDACAACRE
jgi:cysteine-rich repeat protein